MTPRKISYICRRTITRQAVVDGRLVTEFTADPDPLIGYPAGTLICQPLTQADCEAWRQKYGPDDDGLLSETVTRLQTVFWDAGEFTPRAG